MNIVITGHVDHGKSTVVGRLLADTGSLPEGKLDSVKRSCERNSKPFEYAFLLDALKDEQAQGITIDSARIFFKTKKRHYIIIDAPGHIEFLKNMVSGAARAEAALLVIDAKEGIQENSRRHGYMLSMLGVKQVTVLVNKMDLISYSESEFKKIVTEFTSFLDTVGVHPSGFIPVSGFRGENIASRSTNMSWYNGDTVLEALDRFSENKPTTHAPFRMPVQGVYKFTKSGDDRRIIAGTIETGKIKIGDEVVFYPSGKKSTVKTIEAFSQQKLESSEAGDAVGFTLQEQIYISRGEIACLSNEEKPEVSTRLKVSLFWLGNKELQKDKNYILKLGSSRVNARLESITHVLNSSNLDYLKNKDHVKKHEVAECILKFDHALAYDLTSKIAPTSRFVIVDDYEIAGGGIIRETLEDDQEELRKKMNLRNFKWETSFISEDERTAKFQQKPLLLIITGQTQHGRKELAKSLERELFNEGKLVYYLGMANLVHGISADLTKQESNHSELMRRLGEVAHILLNMGSILIVTIHALSNEDLEIIRTLIDPTRIQIVWMGDEKEIPVAADLKVSASDIKQGVATINAGLRISRT